MSIWLYENNSEVPKNSTVKSEICIFCKSKLKKIYEIDLKRENAWNYEHKKQIRVCPICGWWTVIQNYCANGQYCGDPPIYRDHGTTAILKRLDLTNISLPIEDVSQYLLAKYESRFTMHPRLFEETVASVFRNIGYNVRITAYHNDGGIDVVLDGKDDKIIGVQVKRYKNSIEVSQIREFAGALIENDITKGIFVTTSKFQKGAYKSVSNFKERGIGIELVNGDQFYDALQIKQINVSEYEELINMVSKIKLELIYFREYDYNTFISGDEKSI